MCNTEFEYTGEILRSLSCISGKYSAVEMGLISL